MDFSEIMNVLVQSVLIPIILIMGSGLIAIVKSYASKITNSIIERNKMEMLDYVTSTKNNVLEEMETIVQAAVLSNMQIADKMKEGGKKLAEEQINQLNEAADQMIYKALPSSLTDENGTLLKLIGGKERLDSIIDGMVEKSVIEGKAKLIASKNNREW